VIGGTGLVGSRVCEKLKNTGNEVIAGAPSTGINILTGEGLAAALDGTDIVIDLSNAPSPEAQVAWDFFSTAAHNLVKAVEAAGIRHHLVLSIVGTDRAQHIGYLKAKKCQEDAVIGSGVPYTIIRSTQFHEHISTIIDVQGDGKKVQVSAVDYQPIALEDVVDYIVRFALEEPKNRIVEIAGPDRGPMTDFVDAYLRERGSDIVVIADDKDKYMFEDIPRSLLVPSGEFFPGRIKFRDWQQNH